MKKLGFGAMRLPVLDSDGAAIDVKQLTEMVDLFLDHGFYLF